jgi:5-methylcytosine-specific restriction endonuclease McrA
VLATFADTILRRQGLTCLIPGCDQPWTERAHIWPSGLGGQPSTYRPDNLVGLCKGCHDIFDGRDMHGRQRMLRLLMETRRNCVELQHPDPEGP